MRNFVKPDFEDIDHLRRTIANVQGMAFIYKDISPILVSRLLEKVKMLEGGLVAWNKEAEN